METVTLDSNLSSLLLRIKHAELIAGRWGSVETKNLNRNRRSCLLDLLTTLVEESLDTTIVHTSKHYIAHMERT